MKTLRVKPKLYSAVRLWLIFLLIALVGTPTSSNAAPQNAIIPGEIRMDATYEHIGVMWSVQGDENLNSAMTLQFRRQGNTTWQLGAPSMRAYPTIRVQDNPLGLNYWAASAMFLQPGNTYELRLTLADPDGGGEVRTVTATTRLELQPPSGGRDVYIIPGEGGGDGSSGDPYQGLQAAADAAQPGDVFHVAPGMYTPFQLLTSGTEIHPIAFIGPGDGVSSGAGTAIIDGAGTDRGIVTLGEYNQPISYVIVEGLTIQDGRWGVDAQHSRDIVLRHNIIQDVDDGIINRRGDALEGNQTVCDNTIYGRTPWPQTDGSIPGERGIDLRGFGNIICHNTVRYFGDCISLQPFSGPSYGNDVYGNHVSFCVDDGIEIDYNQANARVWRNQAMNARMGISVQPIRGGPAYILRNEFFNLESVPVKMHNYTTGFYVVHNTGVKHGNGYGDNGAMWRNAVLRNNLFLGTRYAFEFTTTADEGFRDLDYGAWGTTRPNEPNFKWDNVRYDRLPDLPPGVEDHGVETTFADLVSAELPPNWYTAVEPGSRDLRLVLAATQIDAGAPLANLNDPFVSDGEPDMGAFEYGEPQPQYGPRPRLPDLYGSSKRASHKTPSFGETLTYNITILNTGAPLTEPLTMTDVVPLGLEYITGSLTAFSGLVDEGGAPKLLWYGTLSSSSPMTITYSVEVSELNSSLISNTALIEGSTLGMLERSAKIFANGFILHLPLIANKLPYTLN